MANTVLTLVIKQAIDDYINYIRLPSAGCEAGRDVLLDGSLVVGFIPFNSDSLFEVDDTGMEGEVEGCLF